jgi:hypothetical protein
VQAIDDLLICFELVLGLKVNLAKSILIPVGEVSNVGALAEVLGCGVGTLPIPYLGLPSRSRFKDKVSWNRVVEKCNIPIFLFFYLVNKFECYAKIISHSGKIPLKYFYLYKIPTTMPNMAFKRIYPTV